MEDPTPTEPDEGDWHDDGDELEAMIERADHAFASESFGTTAAEQLRGETLDDRLREERPSREPEDSALGIEDDGAVDAEDQLVADATDEVDPFASPEESALTIRSRAPGGVDHPEPSVAPVDDPFDEDADDLG